MQTVQCLGGERERIKRLGIAELGIGDLGFGVWDLGIRVGRGPLGTWDRKTWAYGQAAQFI